ncbi:hypothetical protein BSKO_01893 [Bryopsis sp. KO-2023]|nr:hypothetical protein BSKO_01893 [Bryopsis sp. KO-2023]
MDRIFAAAVFGFLCIVGGVNGEACSSDSESSGWELVVLANAVASDYLSPLPKYSYGFKFLTADEHPLTKDTKKATDLLDVSPASALTYRLDADSEVSVPTEKTCDSSKWEGTRGANLFQHSFSLVRKKKRTRKSIVEAERARAKIPFGILALSCTPADKKLQRFRSDGF